MSPGVTEEAGKTARSFFETMKEQPALLVMAIANLALVLFCYFALVKGAELRSDLIKQIFTYQKEISEVLARCVLGPRTDAPAPSPTVGPGMIEFERAVQH